MKRNILFVSCMLLGLLLLGFASLGGASADEVTVPLSNPHYSSGEQTLVTVPALSDFVDISVSSWAPNQMHPASNTAAVSTFSSMYPGFSASYLGAIKKTRTGDFYWRAGPEFRGESRAAPGSPDEDLYLITLRLGVEWKPPLYNPNRLDQYFEPYLGFSLLPTLCSASPTNSSYDNGISSVAFPVELSLGTDILLAPARPNYLRLTIAGQAVFGRVLGSEMFSSGVIGGVRIPM